MHVTSSERYLTPFSWPTLDLTPDALLVVWLSCFDVCHSGFASAPAPRKTLGVPVAQNPSIYA